MKNQTMNQLWTNAGAAAQNGGSSPALTSQTPTPALIGRVKTVVRAVIDWFTEY